MIAGFRDQDNPDQFQFSWNRRHHTSRRFALARLVADHIVAPETESLLPSTDAATTRQRFQRAFAQEFLCPFEDLMEYLQTERPDSDAIERAADQQIGEVASQRPLPEPGGEMATILLVFAPWTLAAVSGVPCTGVSMYSCTLIFMYRWSHVHDKVAVYRP